MNRRRIVIACSGLWMIAQVVGCQAVSGLDELEAQAVKQDPDDRDASSAGSGEHADSGAAGAAGDPMPVSGMGGAGSAGGGMGGVGGTPVPPCETPKNAECNWLTECGCTDDKHCQARGSEAKATCVPRGPKLIGSPCKNADECSEGTCDHGVCTQYCKDNCDVGKCLPATSSTDGKPIPGVNVCWTSCQIKDPKSCSDGTTCQVKGENAFCMPPADPCPTVENGTCDEPNLCAAGTDAKDCSCKPAISGAVCDLVAQCGCAKDMGCLAGGDGATLMCTAVGTREFYETCSSTTECRPGAGCYGRLCKPFCNNQMDCSGEMNTCSPTNHDGVAVPSVKVCIGSCDPNNATSCKKDTVCKPIGTGNYCVWCKPEFEGATCNLAQNCGCEKLAGGGCKLALNANNKPTAQCFTGIGPTKASAACEVGSDCGAGLACVDHVCRKYCQSDRDCTDGDGGACGAITVGGTSAGIGVCNAKCTAGATGVCGAGTVCGTSSIIRIREPGVVPSKVEPVMTCNFVPLTTTCPTTNGRCDEPSPMGSGYCAAGSDTAECM